ncbi:MAG TPA: hypothetical protein VK674_06100 [Candidatus Limnocylindria bacterium]|nr:hypothetical protein [Candidatus Limnocylindria bacterium]
MKKTVLSTIFIAAVLALIDDSGWRHSLLWAVEFSVGFAVLSLLLDRFVKEPAAKGLKDLTSEELKQRLKDGRAKKLPLLPVVIVLDR